MKLSIQDIVSVSKIHVVHCIVPDYKPVYWLVVKPPLDPQHGGVNKEPRVCDVRCKTSIDGSVLIFFSDLILYNAREEFTEFGTSEILYYCY